jgi:UDP-N-acetylglucosamine 2-epimerase (non-hydrolysing)/GDP/UDP-N,N'-diacetylbacillosamine 2-epimerase (hydrolysing)
MNIVYITGSRADFGRMTFILRGLKEHQLSIIVTAQHLQEKAGKTITEIEKDFPIAATVDMTPPDDTTAGMAHALSAGISGMTTTLKKIRPDMIIVLGDRSEMLAGAIGGYFLNIPVWHIGGGFTTGSVDDRIRHTITLFSTYHLVANETCRKKVISLGADEKKTFVVGAPDLEAIRLKDYSAKETLIKKYSIGKEKIVLVSFHPDTDAPDNTQQMAALLDALREIDAQYIITTPNRDAGGDAMERILEKHRLPHAEVFKNIPYKDYLGLMANASAIIGNSSAGIIEAPSFGLPAINIGNRQRTRERAGNVIDVPADKKAITKALDTGLSNSAFIKKARDAKNPYGDGNTSKKAIDLISRWKR